MIRLTLRTEPPIRLDVADLLPGRLAALSAGEIKSLPLAVGNRREKVGDWFKVQRTSGNEIAFEGLCARLDRIGSGMKSGRITVAGDAGAYVGLSMIGGEIAIEGSCDFGAAIDLRGGSITISGNAGNDVGGALPGERSGMQGGSVTIAGRAGDRLGDRMRRGLIVVGGDAGTACGSRMVAGTIVIAGRCGTYPGFAMRRGSVIATGGAERIGVTFADSGVHDLVYLQILSGVLKELGFTGIAERLAGLRRWTGDLATGGKGEILVPA
jgi:formylmethanofuran dehydrogenase subunit C